MSKTNMPESAAFYADMRKHFGKPQGFMAREGGREIVAGSPFNEDAARVYVAAPSRLFVRKTTKGKK